MASPKQKKLHMAIYIMLSILALQVRCTMEEGVERQTVGAGTWCVARTDVSSTELQAALDWVCGQESGQGNVDCSPITTGGACDTPDTLTSHASYAFNVYFQNLNQAAGSCDFGGCAQTSTTDPSLGGCTYPSSATSSGFLTTANVSSTNPSSGGSITRLSLSTPQFSSNILLSLLLPFVFKL